MSPASGPTDRSIPPSIMTSCWPSAMNAIVATSGSIRPKLRVVK